MHGWVKLKEKNPEMKTYVIDLAGYGTSQLKLGKNVVQLAGFSERVFDLINLLEQDADAMVKRIDETTIQEYAKTISS